jgi:hypothetical protein
MVNGTRKQNVDVLSMFFVKPLSLLDVAIGAENGVLQLLNIFHTDVTNSATY